MACFRPIHTTQKLTPIFPEKNPKKPEIFIRDPEHKNDPYHGHTSALTRRIISSHHLVVVWRSEITALGLIWYEGPPARPWGGMGSLWGAPLGTYRPFKGPIRTKAPPDPPQSRIGCTAYHIMASAIIFAPTTQISLWRDHKL